MLRGGSQSHPLPRRQSEEEDENIKYLIFEWERSNNLAFTTPRIASILKKYHIYSRHQKHLKKINLKRKEENTENKCLTVKNNSY